MTEAIQSALMLVYWLAALWLQIYGLNCYIMVFLFNRRRRACAAEEREILGRFKAAHGDEDLPRVTTQLPIFNERNVVERLIRAVCEMDYPAEKHEVQILDDSTDETRAIVAKLVAEMRARGVDIHHLQRESRAGYKAGALAAGMKQARGELIAVFDADFVPPPDFLRRTVPFLVMEPDLGFVQTRWGHRNRHFSLLTRVQAIGIDGHFVIEQSARSWNRLFMNFNGTAGLWRKQAIAGAGGWNSDTLTEDLDLSYRTQLVGWRARFLIDVITPAELPTDVNALKAQQHRWAKGSIQTARKILPAVWRRRDIPFFHKIEATLHLTHYMVHPLLLLMTILILPLLLWTDVTFNSVLMTVPFTLAFLALFAPTTMYLFSQRVANPTWSRTLALVPFLMSVGIGLAVNNTRAVIEALFGTGVREFVRTPKLGAGAEVRGEAPARGAPAAPARPFVAATPAPRWRLGGPVKVYRLPRSSIFVLELLMGAWALAAFFVFLALGKPAASPFLLIHAIGFTYIGWLTLMHDLRARRRAA